MLLAENKKSKYNRSVISKMIKLQFLGACGTVTGSKYLLTVGNENKFSRIMIDCGLFQGIKELRLRNWESCPSTPESCDAVVLTHAHVDHTGYLPRFVQQGFNGPIYATPSTVDLCKILLPDSAHLQEEEARYANKVGSSKHKPAKPLYTAADAKRALNLFNSIPFHVATKITKDVSITFYNAGHILGSSMVEVKIENKSKANKKGEDIKILFSGDLGRYDAPILNDPENISLVHYLVLESTYGNRTHPSESREDSLARIIMEVLEKKGCLLIPSFAIGRTQEILYCINKLEEEDKIPPLPVYVDSPMAIDATKLFQQYRNEHDLEMKEYEKNGKSPFQAKNVRYLRSKEESQGLNTISLPAIIISANGMATGGRILHHLIHRLPDERNIVLFVGFQALGTRGRRMLEGEEVVKLFGEMVPIRAKIQQLTTFSAHADANEILRWLKTSSNTSIGTPRGAPSYSSTSYSPSKVFITHGEPDASEALASRIKEELGWNTVVPKYLEEVELI